MEQRISGVGVLDKSMAVLEAVAATEAPLTLAELVTDTGLSRATAHRLAVALQVHGLLRRDDAGRFALGLRLLGLGRSAASRWPLVEAARPAMEWLRSATGESVQLYISDGQARVCVESLESPHELRTIVEVGARLPLDVGSAGRVLLAGSETIGAESTSNRRRWTESVEERAPGVSSVSAPVREPGGAVVAAIGVSGPLERTTRQPGGKYGAAVSDAADRIGQALVSG